MNSSGANRICRLGTRDHEEQVPTEAGRYWVLIRLGTAMVPGSNSGRFHDSGRFFKLVDNLKDQMVVAPQTLAQDRAVGISVEKRLSSLSRFPVDHEGITESL